MENGKTILLLVVAFVIMTLLFIGETNFQLATTDSGFDVSYDSGSGSSGSSSSDSYSSYDSGGSGEFTLKDFFVTTIVFIILVIIVVAGTFINAYLEKIHIAKRVTFLFTSSFMFLILIGFTFVFVLVALSLEEGLSRIITLLFVIFGGFLSIFLATKQLLRTYKEDIKVEIKKSKVNKMIKKAKSSNLAMSEYGQKILQQGYQIYLDVQAAWMNFDYDALRTLVTDELFNMYEMQLEPLKLKEQQNIMTDFKFKRYYLLSKKEDKDITTIEMILEVAFFDYIINKDKQVIRGSRGVKVVMTYLLTFVLNENELEKCPHCGAKLENGKTVCEYCHSNIQAVGQKMKLAKKEVLNQELEY